MYIELYINIYGKCPGFAWNGNDDGQRSTITITITITIITIITISTIITIIIIIIVTIFIFYLPSFRFNKGRNLYSQYHC